MVVNAEKPVYTEFKIESALMPTVHWTLKGRNIRTGHWEIITSGPIEVMVEKVKEYM